MSGPPGGPNSFNFMQFLGKFDGEILDPPIRYHVSTNTKCSNSARIGRICQLAYNDKLYYPAKTCTILHFGKSSKDEKNVWRRNGKFFDDLVIPAGRHLFLKNSDLDIKADMVKIYFSQGLTYAVADPIFPREEGGGVVPSLYFTNFSENPHQL